ncbi:unnamed protein product [Prunus brigantina]
MKKQPRIDGFFKRKHTEVTSSVPDSNIETVAYENHSGSPRIETTDNEVDISTLERDPGLHSQLQELNSRFSDQTTELLILGSALDPHEVNKSFRIDDICQLVDKFYPQDFEDHEKIGLRRQLQHFESDVVILPEFKNLSTISDLSQWMVTTRRSTTYPLVYRVLVLVLTLPVSTATAERSFSAMRIIKTRLRNKMEDEFLTDSLIMYIEREIAEKFSIDSIIDGFRDMKERRVLF